jgi:hypothetical protein
MCERADAKRRLVRVTCALVVFLFAAGLIGCVREPVPPMTAGSADPQVEAEIARLTQQAIWHLQAQLEVQSRGISVESIRPLESLCRVPDVCPSAHSGYLIRLMVDGLIYEYRARAGEEVSILWCEVPPAPAYALTSPISGYSEPRSR